MDMSAGGEGSWWQRLRTPRGFTATADYFVMDWAAIWRDIAVGLLIAGALAAWVPESWWQSLFLVDHPTCGQVLGAGDRPARRVISFVCSIGNVPLAAVLWNGGISFGGVIAFIFADLIIAADPQHLPQVLRLEDGRLPAAVLLRDDGRGGARSSSSSSRRSASSRPSATRRSRWRASPGTTRPYLNIVFLARPRSSSGATSGAAAGSRCCG